MRARVCQGYQIIQSVKIGQNLELVIGHNPEAYQPYVCWYCNNEESYDTGAYCFNYRQALKALANRITTLDTMLPVEY